MPSTLAQTVPNETAFYLMWVIGGIVAVIGALCFAELTTCYRDRGGDYGYLKRAFGSNVGFAFSWTAFWVIRPGNISAMAIVFGTFAQDAISPGISKRTFALIALIAISGVNLIGLKEGKWSQNLLAVAKVSGILLILLSSVLFSGSPSADQSKTEKTASRQVTDSSQLKVEAASAPKSDNAVASAQDSNEAGNSEIAADNAPSFLSWFSLALVYVMFTFGGWNDIAFVATEVKQPRKNLLWSLILGVTGVLIIYLLFNATLVSGLGFERLASNSDALSAPTELIAIRLGDVAGRVLAALVCVSCMGAISAMIFTSPRIYWATAQDYPGLQFLAGRSDGWRRPMLLQTLVTTIFVFVFGGFDQESFDLLVVASAPYFWSFLGLTVVALIVLRETEEAKPDAEEGFRVPGYPYLPIIFIFTCAFMTYRAYDYLVFKQFGIHAIAIAAWIVFGILIGIVLKQQRPDLTQKSG